MSVMPKGVIKNGLCSLKMLQCALLTLTFSHLLLLYTVNKDSKEEILCWVQSKTMWTLQVEGFLSNVQITRYISLIKGVIHKPCGQSFDIFDPPPPLWTILLNKAYVVTWTCLCSNMDIR